MFEQLMEIVKQNSTGAVIDNPGVPNQHNEGVMNEATTSILSTLKNMIANGQAGNIAALAQDPSHPAVQQMQSNFIENIVQKFGIHPGVAQNISASLIPSVLGSLQSGASGFNLGSLSSIAANFGLDKDKDGDVDFKDITKMFS